MALALGATTGQCMDIDCMGIMPGRLAFLRLRLSAAIDGSLTRLYIGNVPYTFSTDDLRVCWHVKLIIDVGHLNPSSFLLQQIFQVFGAITSCNLTPSTEKPGTHRGYGFIEYETSPQAALAVQTMNGFEVAGWPRLLYTDTGRQRDLACCYVL